MKFFKILIILVILAIAGFSYYQISAKKELSDTKNPLPLAKPTLTPQMKISPTDYPDTKSAIAVFLANKYNKPVTEVKVTVTKEVQGFAAGSVLFGKGGVGEGGMWLAVLGNGWNVVWDGNGSIDCNKMRQDYGFPDTILKPNFCD